MKITILGAGRWASTIALCLDRKHDDVLMWDRITTPENPLFLTGKNRYVELSKRVKFTHDLNEALNYGEVVIISILAQHLDSFMQSVKQVEGYQNKQYMLAMKGIEASTGRRLSEILLDNGVKRDNIAVIVGPGHAELIAAEQPTNMIVSAYNRKLAKKLIDEIQNPDVFDLSFGEDIIGCEIGAAAKNVIGIAAGVLEGSGLEQKKGPLMPAAVKEIGSFIHAMGGDESTASGLAFLGDFQATLFDHNSKNLTYGKTIAEKNTLDEEEVSKVVDVRSVEGIMTSKAIIKKMLEFNKRVTNEKRLKMPLTEAVESIVTGKVPIKEAGDYLSKKITQAINMK